MTPNAIPHYPSSNRSLSQQEPPLHTTTQTQRDMLQKPTVTTPNVKHRRHHQLSSSSEEADDIPKASNNDWHMIRRTKRKKIYSPQPTVSNPLTETHNCYNIITQSANQDESGEQSLQPQNHKPPPTFIHGLINYGEMVKRTREVAEDEQYYTKSLANNIIKLNCTTPDTYRNLIKHFTENGTYYHTYQLKEEGIQSSPQIPPPLHRCGGHPSGEARPGTQGSQYNKCSSQNYKRTPQFVFCRSGTSRQ